MRRKGYLQERRRQTERQRRRRHRNETPTLRSEISDCETAAERSAEPSQKQRVMLSEQKEQVEHAAGRAAEPAEACGTRLEHVPDTDSSDSEQVDDEVHRTGQLKVPEKNGEGQGALEHCVRA